MKKALGKVKNRITKKDHDEVWVVDGYEGSGKSVFAMQAAYAVDPTLNLSRVCMNPEEFEMAIKKAKNRQAIVYDEAYSGLSSRASLSAVNKLLVSKMMEMRQKNLFVLVVLPSFFLLDRYVALFRSRALIHVYESGGRRGYWLGFNRKNKRTLFIYGKKDMNYSWPRINNFRGRFYGKYVVDEQKYRAKHRAALEEKKEKEVLNRFEMQRNILITYLRKKYKLSAPKMAKLLNKLDVGLKRTQIREITIKTPLNSELCRLPTIDI